MPSRRGFNSYWAVSMKPHRAVLRSYWSIHSYWSNHQVIRFGRIKQKIPTHKINTNSSVISKSAYFSLFSIAIPVHFFPFYDAYWKASKVIPKYVSTGLYIYWSPSTKIFHNFVFSLAKLPDNPAFLNASTRFFARPLRFSYFDVSIEAARRRTDFPVEIELKILLFKIK